MYIKGVAHTVFNVFHFLSYFYCIQYCQVFFLKISQLEILIVQFKKCPYNQHNLKWQIEIMKAQKIFKKKVVDKIECAVVLLGSKECKRGGETKRFASHK